MNPRFSVAPFIFSILVPGVLKNPAALGPPDLENVICPARFRTPERR